MVGIERLKMSKPEYKRDERADSAPFYLASGDEVEVFEAAYRAHLPVILKGPTGCGKTRFVSHMAHRLGTGLNTVACHDDLTASDLVGRFLIKGRETVWVDGPLTKSVREGSICYLDEVVEARKDTTVVIHPLTDDRRTLFVEKTGEAIIAPPGFMLVVSCNPGYQHVLKDLKTSTRQRFVALEFTYPDEVREAEVIVKESSLDAEQAKRLVGLGRRLRSMAEFGLDAPPGTRLLVHAAILMSKGLSPKSAIDSAIIQAVTDDPEARKSMLDIVEAAF